LEANISYYQQNESHKDNAKFFFIKDKKIEIFKLAEQASIIGDTVGDPLKDTSGPSLNILIKLSSIISVIFGTVFVNTAWLKSWT
jgi:K(+)-stimulated pyrophosphate-energized sodium pump